MASSPRSLIEKLTVSDAARQVPDWPGMPMPMPPVFMLSIALGGYGIDDGGVVFHKCTINDDRSVRLDSVCAGWNSQSLNAASTRQHQWRRHRAQSDLGQEMHRRQAGAIQSHLL